MYLEGLFDEFYEDNGDEYTDDSDDLSEITAMGAKVRRIEAS